MIDQPTDATTVIWLETEQFEHFGGWVNDSQFIDRMGSPYLLANGWGTPVEDAVTIVKVLDSGPYRLWARTRDWDTEHHPGRFQILLNGQAVERTFGCSGQPGWAWEDGGTHELSGPISLALHDLSGYYSRCDVVILTDDLAWTPPEGNDDIEALRVRYGGLSAKIDEPPAYDVVVVGGGLAGCTAAVAAARNGAAVALIQDRPVLGGNASPEILVPPTGVANNGMEGPLDPRETGIIEEYRTPGLQRVTEGKLYAKRLLRWVQLEPNLDLYLNMHVLKSEMLEGDRREIESVLAVDVHTGQRMRFRGTIFIDCSGDSVMGVSAGAEYRQGKEPQSMYGEPWAPETASPHTMGNGLKYYPVDTGREVRYDPPPWAYRFPDCADFGPGRHPQKLGTIQPDGLHIGHQWKLELGGTRDTFVDAEDIRDDLFRLIFGIWDHVKNHCPENAAQAATWDLGWVGHVAGKRETRRLIGDIVLTQNDIGSQALFPDRVAYGAWSVDDHYPEGFFHKGPTGRHFDGADHHYRGVPFSIPFRSLYSRNVDNLMMAGRNHSASHLGMSDTRVMITCAVMGHAAGVGAALCVAKDLSPRGVYQDCIEHLQQQLLKEGAFIIGLRAKDARDAAPRARIGASSECVWDNGGTMAATNVIDGYARAIGEHTHAWSPDPNAPGPHWIELAWDAPVTFNVVHVGFQKVDLAPESFCVEAWQDGWRTVAEVSENRHRRHVLGLDRVTTTRLRVVESDPAGIVDDPRL